MLLRLRAPYRITFVVFITLIAFSNELFAAENRTITVSASGLVTARPDAMMISGRLSTSAKLVEDALSKFEAQKRRLKTAIEKLNFADLTMRAGGVTVGSIVGDPSVNNDPFGAGPDEEDLEKVIGLVQVSEPIHFRVSGLAKSSNADLFKRLANVVEMAKDNGVLLNNDASPEVTMLISQSGESFQMALASYEVSEHQPVLDAAYEAAMKDARTKADRLARLSNAELGRVVTIRETAIRQRQDKGMDLDTFIQQMYGYSDYGRRRGSPFVSDRFGEFRIEAKLKVTFELVY